MKFSTSSRIGGSVLVAVAFLVMSTQGAGAQTAWTCNGLAATLVGTPGPDTLRGTAGVDVIVGREGNDVITGLGGDDIVCAGKGDDTIFGGDGFDIIFAAQGNDTIYAANGATAALRSDTRGARMFGGAGNDIIHGSNKWDRMQGGIGVDTLFGYEGRDWMRAGPGNDQVDGGSNIDDMHGGNGADVIEMTSGDVVRGGAGLDQCNIAAGEADRLISCGLNVREGATPAPVTPAPTPTPEPPSPSPNGFTYTEGAGVSWIGEVFGLAPTTISEFSDEVGRCYLLVGQLTPQTIDSGVVSSGFETPAVGVIAGGEYIDDAFGCNAQPAEALGYDWILNAEALPGTTIPFHAHIFIPSTNQGAISSIVVGDPRFNDDFLTFPAEILASVPTPAGLLVGAPAPATPVAGSAFTYTDSATDSWTGKLESVNQVPFNQFDGRDGRCFVVLGELTPTSVDGLVSSGFSTPNIGGLVAGRYVPDSFGCDTSAAEAQGYGWILNAEVTVGTPYKFFAVIVVPAANTAPLSQIVVGSATESAVVYDVG